MTTKERLHSLVDELNDEQLEQALAYLDQLLDGLDAEPLSEEDLASIRRGVEDIGEGRSVTLDEYEQGKRP